MDRELRLHLSEEDADAQQTGGQGPVELIGHTGDLRAQSPGIARKIRGLSSGPDFVSA